jgi:hypothetical protein
MSESRAKAQPMFKVRNSRIHGKGVFALRRIRKGTRITEYLGERVSHAEADRRYEDKAHDDNHTFLFIVDARTVIDAGVGGSDARFINHSCAPNCETVVEHRRIFIEAIRTIEPGDELSYDYQIGRDADDPEDVDTIYACRCGAAECRGTMLWPAKRRRATTSPARKTAAKRGVQRRGKTGKTAKTRKSSKTGKRGVGGKSGAASKTARQGGATRGKKRVVRARGR